MNEEQCSPKKCYGTGGTKPVNTGEGIPQVQQQLVILGKMVEECDQFAADLEKRLGESVLSEKIGFNEDDIKKETIDPPMVHLAYQINHANKIIARTIARLTDIMDRIEI